MYLYICVSTYKYKVKVFITFFSALMKNTEEFNYLTRSKKLNI